MSDTITYTPPPVSSPAEMRSLFSRRDRRLDRPRSFESQNFSGIKLDGWDLTGCNFVGADFSDKQSMAGANLAECRFGPAQPGFQPVSLKSADLSHADLRGAQLCQVSLQNCVFESAKLSNADDLSDSDCTGADFTNATLQGANLSRANLFNARFHQTRLSLNGRVLLQNSKRDWQQWCLLHHPDVRAESDRLEQGAAIYLELKENFRSIGAYAEASQAYVWERRMRRNQHHPRHAHACFAANYPANRIGQLWFHVWHTTTWAVDWAIDATTGYGESLLRPSVALAMLVAIGFPVLYGYLGGVNLSPGAAQPIISTDYAHLLLFSLGNVVQGSGFAVIGQSARLWQVVQQFSSILLVGLLGFILGKKINQT